MVKVVEDIEAEQPDTILNLIQGQVNLAFIHQLRKRDSIRGRIPSLSFCFSEHDLLGVLNKMVGDYVCGHYFQGLKTPENAAFLRRVAVDPRLAGIPIVSDAMVAAYMGVHLWAAAVARAGTFESIAAIRRAMVALRLPGPGGPVQIDPVAQCDSKYLRVARVGADRKIAITWTSRQPIPPVAYPETRTPAQWDEWLRALKARWGGHWSNREPVPSTLPD